MSGLKVISEYFSDDGLKTASVIKELGTSNYIVQIKSDSGSSFSATFESIDKAEDYAENWVS